MIRAFGEAALLVDVGDPGRARSVASSLSADPIDGIVELVPGLGSILVELDPSLDPESITSELRARVEGAAVEPEAPPRRRVIPVVYGGLLGPDLDDVAGLCGLAPEEVISRHAGLELRVLFDGFAPGFAYLGTLPPELRVPRLATPRTRTPAGSVAVAEGMSGIYPADLPGGWRVIGRTPLTLFDPRRDPPAYLIAGDAVRFEPISEGDWAEGGVVPTDW